MIKKIIEEKIKNLESEKREGIDDIVRLGQIVILKDVLIDIFKKETK